jgi:hypothetical protein
MHTAMKNLGRLAQQSKYLLAPAVIACWLAIFGSVVAGMVRPPLHDSIEKALSAVVPTTTLVARR